MTSKLRNFYLNTSKSFYFSSVFLLFTFLFFIFTRAHAQQQAEGFNVTLSPFVIELSNTPGAEIQSRFRIRNNADTPVNLHLSVAKLAANGDSVQPTAGSPEDEFLHWLTFDQATLSARPKEWTDVRFSLTIPPSAAFGYYYAIRVTQIPSQSAPKTTTAKLLGEVVLPVLLEIQKDGTIAEAQVVDFKPVSYINEYLPVDFIARVKNTGNIHIRPRGNIFIQFGGSKDLAILDVNQNQGSIIPGSTRNFQSSWTDGFFVREPVLEDDVPKVDSNGKPVTHLAINWDKITSFRLGKYTANLLLVYDNGKRDIALDANTSFWVIPYTIIAVLLISILLIIIMIRLLLKAYVKTQLKKYQGKA